MEKNDEKGLVASSDLPAISDNSIIAMAEQAEARIKAVNKIKKMSLKVTNYHDWVDQNGKPYLQASGGEKVARLFGISWRIDEPVKEELEGDHYTYTYKGYFSLAGAEIECIGTRSSKDGFFKRYSGSGEDRKELPASEIASSDVKKSALTNLIGNGITRILGIRNLTYEDLEEAGINVPDITKVRYTQKEEGQEGKNLRFEIQDMLDKMFGTDKEEAKGLLVELTSFIPAGKTEAERVKGKDSVGRLTEKQLSPVYGRVKTKYEAWQKTQKKPSETPQDQKTEGKGSDTLYDEEKCGKCLNLLLNGKLCARLSDPIKIDACKGVYE